MLWLPTLALGLSIAGQPSAISPEEGDWPMLAHDPARSGATPVELRPPFTRKWYRLFPEEGLMAGVQPVIARGRVYVGTLAGVLHAMDAGTGRDVWSFRAGGAILHTAAVRGDLVYFGSADRAIHAVRVTDGSLAWKVDTGSAVWNSPLVHEDTLVIGSRDGILRAIQATTGAPLWSAPLGAPILASPAMDIRSRRIYAASEDMRAHALDAVGGRIIWSSEKLPGVSLRGYHPVVAPDGSIIIGSQPGISLDDFQPVLLEVVKEVFGDFASWRHTKEENEKFRRANLELLAREDTYGKQMGSIRRRLETEPAYRTFFVLDPETGRERFTASVVYAESMNGTAAPAIVTSRGEVVIKYQALLRSRYEHYSPFLNVGRIDTASGRISPIMDQRRTYGWHDSLLLVHDEQCQLAAGGRILFNTHQDNVNALDLDTLEGWKEPLCRNIHEPAAGEAAAIWTRLLRGEELPPGKEWLARGTAVYGGGSVIDTSITIAGDSFYYVPTHEISSGCAVIAYASRKDAGSSGIPAEPVRGEVTADAWRRIQELPWDWDTLEISRLRHVLDALPGSVPGTRRDPLEEEGERAASALGDDEIDRYIWMARKPSSPDGGPWDALRSELRRAVAEIVSRDWEPLLFPAGKHPMEAYRVFTDPSETLLALALAYPHLDAEGRAAAAARVDRLISAEGPLFTAPARRDSRAEPAAVRSAYEPPAARLVRAAEERRRSALESLHPLWLWMRVSGEWTRAKSIWHRARQSIGEKEGPFEIDCGNARAAGLIAYARIARKLGDAEALSSGLAAARKALRGRVAYEAAHPRGGVILPVPVLRSAFSRWHRLSPEVGRLCAERAAAIQAPLHRIYVEHHRPTWWLAWNVETLMRNECPLELPWTSLDIFEAKAWILREPAGTLARYVDIPWCRADEYRVRKIALVLDAAGGERWEEIED